MSLNTIVALPQDSGVNTISITPNPHVYTISIKNAQNSI